MSAPLGVGSPDVVVYDDDRRAVLTNGRAQHLCHADVRGVHRALVYLMDPRYLGFHGKQEDAEVFLIAEAHVCAQDVQHVAGVVDDGAVYWSDGHGASA